MAYQGWKNWETWNVALWLGNDEPLYRATLALAPSKIGPHKAELIVKKLLPAGTRDFRSAGGRGSAAYAVVDWQEIANDINEMAGHT